MRTSIYCAMVRFAALSSTLHYAWRVVWQLYRDAFKGLPGMWRSRRVIQRSRAISLGAFGQVLTPRFYDRQYLRQAWQQLWRGRKDD